MSRTTISQPLDLDQQISTATWRDLAADAVSSVLELLVDDEDSTEDELAGLRYLSTVLTSTTFRLTDAQMDSLYSAVTLEREICDDGDAEWGSYNWDLKSLLELIEMDMADRGFSS